MVSNLADEHSVFASPMAHQPAKTAHASAIEKGQMKRGFPENELDEDGTKGLMLLRRIKLLLRCVRIASQGCITPGVC
jgi:hypothetical protein